MEKKIFSTVDEVAEYLNSECYYKYLDTDCYKELENIEVEGYKKFTSGKKYYEKSFEIYFGFDEVVAIFATEDTIEYIWKTRDKNDFEYEARVVDKEEIANAIAEYPQYVKESGCLDVSSWLMEEYCDSRLSVDYEVMTTIGRIWQ